MFSHSGPVARTVLVAAVLALDCPSALGQAENASDELAGVQIHSSLSESVLAPAGGAPMARTGNPVEGEALYDTYCVGCHGTSGRGDGPAAAILHPKPRDHTNRAYMDTLTDQYLSDIIRKGGVALGRSAMMPPAKTLTDENINDLIARIRSLAQ